jgi:uncharacterized protein DUF397
MDVDLDGATWRKSSYSNGSGGNCVEVADLPSGRAVRDSKHPEGPTLIFSKGGWQAFVQGIRAGELCAELEPGQAAGICREGPGHNPLTARNEHNSETTGAGGESPREPLADRQLELDLLRQHIARVVDTGAGHAVLILGESGAGKSRRSWPASGRSSPKVRSASAVSTRNCPAS